jgi:hypothetical protein
VIRDPVLSLPKYVAMRRAALSIWIGPSAATMGLAMSASIATAISSGSSRGSPLGNSAVNQDLGVRGSLRFTTGFVDAVNL